MLYPSSTDIITGSPKQIDEFDTDKFGEGLSIISTLKNCWASQPLSSSVKVIALLIKPTGFFGVQVKMKA